MKNCLLFILSLVSFCTFIGCRSAKQAAQLIREVQKDTIYLSSLQYDSIFIIQERTSDYHMNPLNPLKPSETDTVFIKDVSVEYRYRLLRDTVYQTQIDSIPVIREVEVVREIPRKYNWIDYLCYTITAILSGLLLIRVLRYLRGQ